MLKYQEQVLRRYVVEMKRYKMTLRLKIITGILVAIAAIIALIRFMPHKAGDGRAYFLGVDGDPRMKACNSVKDAENATQPVIDALKIGAPLTIGAQNSADYRVSVFHAGGGKAISIHLATPKKGVPAIADVGVYENGIAKFETQNLIYEQAKALINSFEAAKIWGPLKTTFEPRKNTGPASVVIEIQAPNSKRCITTRYDDERVTGLLNEFANRIKSVVKEVDISGFEAPKKTFGKSGQ